MDVLRRRPGQAGPDLEPDRPAADPRRRQLERRHPDAALRRRQAARRCGCSCYHDDAEREFAYTGGRREVARAAADARLDGGQHEERLDDGLRPWSVAKTSGVLFFFFFFFARPGGNLGSRLMPPRVPTAVNPIERRMSKFMSKPPSVRVAASVIVTATTVVVVAGGISDPPARSHAESLEHLGRDVVGAADGDHGRLRRRDSGQRERPASSRPSWSLEGIAFLAITTAVITSAFVARAESERDGQGGRGRYRSTSTSSRRSRPS